MKLRSWRGTILIITLTVIVLGLTGCAKQRASYNTKKLRKLIANAQEYNAEKHAKSQLDSATKALKEAEGLIAGNQGSAALERARRPALPPRSG